MAKKVIILGAGPKGVALGTKRECLGDADLPEYVIIERHKPGAHWSGKHGYTDGEQFLVNQAIHDLGFPYTSQDYFKDGETVNSSMLDVSWESYLASKKKLVNWYLNNSLHPNHEELVAYLDWASKEKALKIEPTNVKTIGQTTEGWSLSCESDSGKSVHHSDALVITGHGGPKSIDASGSLNPRMSDGRNFWQRLSEFDHLAAENVIGVVGAGETAAAIANKILCIIKERNLEGSVELNLICKQPSYFLRSDLVKELKYFADPDTNNWSGQPLPDRKGIIQRADRGVVSANIKRNLELSNCVNYIVAEAAWPKGYVVPETGPIKLILKYKFKDEPMEPLEKLFDYLVFAFGFDDLWFLKLFEEPLLVKFVNHLLKNADSERIKELSKILRAEAPGEPVNALTRSALVTRFFRRPKVNRWLVSSIERVIDHNLAVDGFKPKLFLPRLSGVEHGPGLPNLNCLGLMSDKVWSAFFRPS